MSRTTRKGPRLVRSRAPVPNRRPVDREKACLPPAVDDGAIARLREIARAPDELDRLVDGAQSHPDAQLLDLCAEALHVLKLSNKQMDEWRDGKVLDWHTREGRAAADAMFGEYKTLRGMASSLLRRIRKLRSATAAGVYAKALLVRDTSTGAPMLAKSLAEDLIAIPGLRASLWPTGTEGDVA